MSHSVKTTAGDRKNFLSRARLKTGRKPKPGAAARRGKVLIVDRRGLMRFAAAEWINSSPDLKVCGMAGGATHAFMAVNQSRPDVIVSEIMRPRDLGFIRELHRRHPCLPIIVFSTQDEALYGSRAREAGACSYLMKDAGGDKLLQTVLDVLRERRAQSQRSRSGDSLRHSGKSPGRVQQRADCANNVHKAKLHLELPRERTKPVTNDK